MKASNISITPILKIASVFLLVIAGLARSSGASSLASFSASSGYVKLTCTIPKEVPVGSKVPLEIKITNSDVSSLLIGESDGWPKQSCKIQLTDATGREVQPFESAKWKLGRHRFSYIGESFGIESISSGGERKWVMDLHELFPMKPGKYSVTFEFRAGNFHSNRGNTITLNAVTFTVLPDPK